MPKPNKLSVRYLLNGEQEDLCGRRASLESRPAPRPRQSIGTDDLSSPNLRSYHLLSTNTDGKTPLSQAPSRNGPPQFAPTMSSAPSKSFETLRGKILTLEQNDESSAAKRKGRERNFSCQLCGRSFQERGKFVHLGFFGGQYLLM